MSENQDGTPAAPDENSFDLVIRGRRILGSTGFAPAEIGILNGVISTIAPWGSGLRGRTTMELADDETLLPGLVDTHVHVNEPGRTEWEGFASATRAAAAGGVTTIIDMPLNSIPPTVDAGRAGAQTQAAAAARPSSTSASGAAPSPATRRAAAAARRRRLRLQVLPRRTPASTSSRTSTPDELRSDLAELAPLRRAADRPRRGLRSASSRRPQPAGRDYADFLASRPARRREHRDRRRDRRGAAATGARVHILHLSSADALPLIAAAKRDGVRITVETCPHYLTLTAEEIPDGATAFKCCPPIREAANRDALWQGLADGTIDCVVSDHSPCTPDLKDLGSGDFAAAWGGIVLPPAGPARSSGPRPAARGIALDRVVRWMSSGPADLAGLTGARAASPPGATPTSSSSPPRTTFTVDAGRAAAPEPDHPVRREGRCTGVVRRTVLAGADVDPAVPPGGCCGAARQWARSPPTREDTNCRRI